MKLAEVGLFSPSGTQETFHYLIPGRLKRKVKTGSLVEIPFGSRKTKGVVLRFAQTSPLPLSKLKKIKKVFEGISLPPYQIELALWMSEYYISPLYRSLKFIFPFHKISWPSKINQIKKTIPKLKNKLKKKRLSQNQREIINKIINAQPNLFGYQPFLIFDRYSNNERLEIYVELIRKIILDGGQVMILFPEVFPEQKNIQKLIKIFGENIALIRPNLTPKQKFILWQQIYHNQKKIIIGSRSALFMPANNLKMIIIDEEHDQNYKEEQTPRYQVQKVAIKLAELKGIKVILASSTPSIESFYKSKIGEYKLLKLKKKVSFKKPKIQILDLRKSKELLLPPLVKSALENYLKRKKRVILFVNRRGLATNIFCQDCGLIPLCQNCDAPLVFHKSESKNILICYRCGYQEKAPRLCPNCQSHRLKLGFLGTQGLEKEIRKLFPKIKIIRVDSQTIRKQYDRQRIYKELKLSKNNLIIGTQALNINLKIPKADLLIIFGIDQMLGRPDYKTEEKVFQIIANLIQKNLDRKKGTCLIQSYNPHHPAIKAISSFDFERLYQAEIDKRKLLSYPPFSQFIKIVFQHKKQRLAQEKIEKLAWQLTKNQVSILGPTPCFISKLRGKYCWQIIIKKPLTLNPSILKKILRPLREGFTIDVDPEQLI